MKFVNKIVMLVLVQIIVIVTSFMITAYLESQNTLAGHTINIAGKNRVLASQVEIELYRLVLEGDAKGDLGNIQDTLDLPTLDTNNVRSSHGIFDALRELETNILLLKHGGNQAGIEIPRIPSELDKEWQDVADTFDEYYDIMLVLSNKQNITVEDIRGAEETEIKLIGFANTLTEELSRELEWSSFQLVTLQVLLGIVNVIIHVFMIWIILQIFNRHAKESIKQEKFVVLGEFAASLAHDMRTPMGTIYNSINLISKNIKDERGLRELARINRAVKRMSNQIDNIINYVKTPKLDLGSQSFIEIMNLCIKDIRIPDNIKLNLPERDTVIYCDSKRIGFVFTNLILNAVQALGGNRGHITTHVKDTPGRIMISFENSGSPIPQEDLKKIFEPLYTTKMQGTGLGLTSCKNIIDAHNGTITVSNNPVTFTISLPKDDTVAL